MPNLEWKATAIADLLAIIDYISDDNPDAAQFSKMRLNTDVLLPERLKCIVRPCRWDPGDVVRPNYIVVYVEGPEMVTILRVLHAAQQWP
ncbi:type II toxin-antitoxin system RelE/ParE family toxin [Roseovarius sp. MS2]|uniref:type II toxin-antitoxin system RelE/ParE family toxin n=1 Tax=Roseovarius sp. MS2 TaxID=3390728 RepID=UPI003EDBDF65